MNDFPENAAHWTGEKVLLYNLVNRPGNTDDVQVGEAEQIPDNIEAGWDNAVDNIEDAPENAAEWTGEKFGAVESFGDGLEDAYDEGEAEGRDDW